MLAITTQRLLPSLLSLALLLGSIFFPPLARAEGSAGTQVFTFDETDRIKELIVETLMERPEILIEMSEHMWDVISNGRSCNARVFRTTLE